MLVWYFLYCIKEACLCYDFMIFVVLLHAKTVVSQFAFTLARVICLSKSFTCQKPPFLLRLQIINITIVLLEKMKSSFCFDHNENGWCVWQKYIILIFFFNWLILFSAKMLVFVYSASNREVNKATTSPISMCSSMA